MIFLKWIYDNNTEHTPTKHKPVDLRDTPNMALINEVNENMKKTITAAIKYKNLYLLEAKNLLLVNSNIKLKFEFEREEIIKKIKKKKETLEFLLFLLNIQNL